MASCAGSHVMVSCAGGHVMLSCAGGHVMVSCAGGHVMVSCASIYVMVSCAGGQKLLEAYARVQQLRGMPTSAPANISPTLQQTSKVPPDALTPDKPNNQKEASRLSPVLQEQNHMCLIELLC